MDYTERLNKLDDRKLIDVVKNHRQYGYDDDVREIALSILNERGITKEQLQLTGNLENKTYDFAQELIDAFSRNSKIAFILYGILLFTTIILPFLVPISESLVVYLLILNWISLISYFVFMVKSFMNQQQFYKTINQDYGTEGALIYLFLGMPFYIFMYFYFQNQMKEKMKEVK
jgi:lipopolysaccharide export system permease protein